MTQAEIVLHKTKDPTRVTYVGLTEAYDWFNAWLFAGELPRALITMQRRKGSYGYFAPKRFGTRDEVEIVDEIALNPTAFRIRTDEETLSTLVSKPIAGNNTSANRAAVAITTRNGRRR